MLRKLLPVVLVLSGTGAGIGTGLALRTPPSPPDAMQVTPANPREFQDFVKLPNQFVVPVVESGRVGALVILSLTVEVEPGKSEEIFQREPKLRDAFLRVMFDHANVGGFRGTFTDETTLTGLRRALTEAAQGVAGPIVRNVLIVDIQRQDS